MATAQEKNSSKHSAAPTPPIFDHGSFGEWLSATMAARKGKDAGFSYAVLARTLKVRSPSLLAMIAREERFPKHDLVVKLCDYLKLSRAEQNYAEALVNFQKAKDPQTKARYAEKLRIMRPLNERIVIELDAFQYIAQWYHFTILELTQLPAFVEDSYVISSWLGSTVSPEMVQESLSLLQRLKLLHRLPTGRLAKTGERVDMPKNVPSASVRLFHKQMLMRAHQAMDRQSVDERVFLSVTLPVNRKRLAEAQRRIREFREAFANEFVDLNDGPDEVYHLAIQFFRLTEVTSSRPEGQLLS